MRVSTAILFIAAALTGASTLPACKSSNDRAELAHHHHDHGAEEHAGHGGEIELAPAEAKALGVESDTVNLTAFNGVIKCAGRIMPSTQDLSVAASNTPGIITLNPGIAVGAHVNAGAVIGRVKATDMAGGDANAAAQVAYAAAQREVDRLKPLHDVGIVSTADFNAALAARDVAKASFSTRAASGTVTAKTSGTITALNVQTGQFVDAGAPVAEIAASADLTLEANLPQRDATQLGQIQGAKVRTPYADDVIDLTTMGLKRQTGTPTPKGGYVPIYFTFNNAQTKLLPGTPVEVFLQTSARDNVISLPVGALSEQQGSYFVYQQLDEDCYKKLPVTIGPSDGQYVEILSGVKPGQRIVIAGAKVLHLSETSSAVPEGHSHQH